MTELTIRLRLSNGSRTIKVPDSVTLLQLKQAIEEETKIEADCQKIKLGYPPRDLEAADDALVKEIGITTGETLVVEQGDKPAAKLMNAVNSEAQIPDSDGRVMIRRVVPADNSCLFNSIAYAMEGRQRGLGGDLREIIAAFVMSDPVTYSEAVLEKDPETYQLWIMQDTSWGGAIELSILAKYYQIQIATVNIQNLRVDIYGQEEGFDNRIYLIYDGIHYDVLVRNFSEESSEAEDLTIFSQNDEVAMNGAVFVGDTLRKQKQFTDTSKFALVCGTCYKGLTGQQEAVEHCRQTGHTNFQQAH